MWSLGNHGCGLGRGQGDGCGPLQPLLMRRPAEYTGSLYYRVIILHIRNFKICIFFIARKEDIPHGLEHEEFDVKHIDHSVGNLKPQTTNRQSRQRKGDNNEAN